MSQTPIINLAAKQDAEVNLSPVRQKALTDSQNALTAVINEIRQQIWANTTEIISVNESAIIQLDVNIAAMKRMFNSQIPKLSADQTMAVSTAYNQILAEELKPYTASNQAAKSLAHMEKGELILFVTKIVNDSRIADARNLQTGEVALKASPFDTVSQRIADQLLAQQRAVNLGSPVV
jgi:hypothetical protein